MATEKSSQIERMFEIIKQLSMNEQPTIEALAQQFGCSTRTIRRDVKELSFYNDTSIDKKSGKITTPEGQDLNTSKLLDDELLITELAFSAIKGMSKEVQEKINSIRKKVAHPTFFSPYLVKAELFQEINVDRDLLNKIEDAIQCKNIATVIGQEQHSKVEPYRVVAFDGIWYLFAKDLQDQKIKTYLLSQMKNFRASLETYDVTKEQISTILDGMHSAWYEDGNSFTVTIKVHQEIAHFFKLKKHLSTQKIIKENSDGSLIITFQVSTDEDVDNLIKAWLPHIEILRPERLRKKLIIEITSYLNLIKTADFALK